MNDEEQKEAAFTLLNSLMSNPETRRQTQMMVKKINPKASIPEIDAALPVMAELQKTNKVVEELRAELMKRDVQSEISKSHKSLRNKGYSDDGIEKIEKLMTDRGIADYEAASALFDRMNPAPSPTAPSYVGQRFMETGTDDFKRFMKSPESWVEEETGRALADFRSGRAQ